MIEHCDLAVLHHLCLVPAEGAKAKWLLFYSPKAEKVHVYGLGVEGGW